MYVRVVGKPRGTPTVTRGGTFAWECVPRVGDLFVFPEERRECEETGVVKSVAWMPSRNGNPQVFVTVTLAPPDEERRDE